MPIYGALFLSDKEVIFIEPPKSENPEDINYHLGMHTLYGNFPHRVRNKLPANMVRTIADYPEVVRLLSNPDINYEPFDLQGTTTYFIANTSNAS